VNTDRLVSPRLARLPIGVQEQSRGLPADTPLGLGERRCVPFPVAEGMAQLGEPLATTAYRYPTLTDPFLDLGETRL
jgi:hypothetical protein